MKTKKAPVLNKTHLTALRQAVRHGKDWRGSLVGNDGTDSTRRDEAIRLDMFDLMTAEWDKALKAVSAQIKKRTSAQRIAKRNKKGWPHNHSISAGHGGGMS